MPATFNNLMGEVNHRFKAGGYGIFVFILKIISGLILGLTLSLIGEEMIGYGTFSFIFVMIVITLAFLKLAKSWNLVGVVVFDVFCVLLSMLLRMYILYAPGA